MRPSPRPRVVLAASAAAVLLAAAPWQQHAIREFLLPHVNPPALKMGEIARIPTAGSVVRNVTVGSIRGRLWLAESGVSRLGRIELR